jgi:hypothetical protein
MSTARRHGPVAEEYGVPFTIALMRLSLDEPRMSRAKRGTPEKRLDAHRQPRARRAKRIAAV